MSDAEKYRNSMRYVSLGTQWMIMLLVAVFGGWKLDKMIGWKIPLLLITLPLIALGVSMWQLIRESNKPKK